ncbi:MAG TPA: hypothetical protein VM053_01555 [Gemmatimonadaceae bacterium]|nr:hypothetical protein [Gemmatimonadaceae bacterium]
MIADLIGRQRPVSSSNNAFVAIGLWARRMSDRKLVGAEVAGFGGAVAVVALTPGSIEIALLATALGSLGLWGVTDHMFEARDRLAAPLRWMLKSFRFAIAAAGISAVILAGYALIGRLMGVFIL